LVFNTKTAPFQFKLNLKHKQKNPKTHLILSTLTQVSTSPHSLLTPQALNLSTFSSSFLPSRNTPPLARLSLSPPRSSNAPPLLFLCLSHSLPISFLSSFVIRLCFGFLFLLFLWFVWFVIVGFRHIYGYSKGWTLKIIVWFVCLL
jgi:hypothetical protein